MYRPSLFCDSFMCAGVGTDFFEHRFWIDWAQRFTDWIAHGLQFAEGGIYSNALFEASAQV